MPQKRSNDRAYREGTWFHVPLRSGGHALGVVARKAGNIFLGYFFGPAIGNAEHPTREIRPRAHEAVLVALCGDLGLVDGTWPIVGTTEGWDPKDWPVPRFVRWDPLSRQARAVQYDPENLAVELESADIDDVTAAIMPMDGVFGAGAVELTLTRQLAVDSK